MHQAREDPKPPTPVTEVPTPGLRARVLRGGSMMAARQGLGVLVSLVGVVLVTRLIGPAEYGLFAASIGVFTYAFCLAGWGIDIYLMRQPEDAVSDRQLHQAFTLGLCLSLGFGGAGAAAVGLLDHAVGLGRFAPVLWVFFACLPLSIVCTPARVKLERGLAYDRIAVIELFALFQFQAVALGLAYAGYGAWSLVASWVVNQVLMLSLVCAAAKYLPRLAWDGGQNRRMLGFGLGYTASAAAIQLRTLINPLIVVPFAGAAAAGYVGMATMFAFRLSVIKHLSEKMAVAALAKVQHRRERVRELVGEGMRLQVLCVGVPLAGFAWAGPWLIPRLMGSEWRPVADLLPLVAIGFLASAVFGLHASVLQVYERNWSVAGFNAALMTALFGLSWWLVPRIGYLGYGWAEVMTLPTYLLMHLFLKREVGTPDYRVAVVWAAGLSLLMLAPRLGVAAWVCAAAVLAWPVTWTHLAGHARQLRQAVVVRA
ncbi:MAG: oligosaccharide flippase family protein [Planctomycetota bacterium]